MMKAIYSLREDGDYDFIAAFETERIETLIEDSDMDEFIEEHIKGLENAGEAIIVEFGGASDLVDVYAPVPL